MALILTLLILGLAISALICYYAHIFESLAWVWALPLMTFGFWWVLFFIYAIIVIAMGLYYQRHEKRYGPNRFGATILSQTCYTVLFLLRCRVHGSGLGKLDNKRSFMIVSNHLSAVDHMGLVSLLKGYDLIGISKKENENMFSFGGWIKRAGYLPIDQHDMVSGTEVIQMAGQYLKRDMCSVMIAPEGTRNKTYPDPLLLPFHPGSFQMAYDSHAPIALFAIQNTYALWKRFPLHVTDLYFDVVAVIEYEEYKDLSPAELALKCHDLILARLEKKMARSYHKKVNKENESSSSEENK